MYIKLINDCIYLKKYVYAILYTRMNYYLQIMYFKLTDCCERFSNGWNVCCREYNELSEYMLENKIIF